MSNERKRILLLVDFKYRDLPGLVLLKSMLERRGPYDVILAPHIPSLGEELYLRSVKPHMVVFPRFVSQAHSERARRLKEHGIGVAVVSAEGQHFTPEGRLQMAGKLADLTPVDLFFVWNRGIFELVHEHRTIDPGRCILGGVPRFDFYHPRFRAALEPRESFCARYRLDPRRPIVTWATNFGWPGVADRPDLIAEATERYRREGLEIDVAAVVRKDVESRRTLTELALEVARRFPQAQLLIKLHPSEESWWYEARVAEAGLENVRLLPREYIWHVLNATDIELHRSCTTSIEAWMLDKPTIDLQMVPGEWISERDMWPGGDVALSGGDALDRVAHYLSGGAIPTPQQEARRSILEWFAGPCDGLAAERHVDAMQAWLDRQTGEPTVPRDNIWDWRSRVTTAVKPLLGLQQHESIKAWLGGGTQDTRGKYFTSEDVSYWLARSEAALSGA